MTEGMMSNQGAPPLREDFIRRMFLLPLTLLLAGCPGIYGDFVYGFRRDADLETMPSVDCVRESIRSTPGIATIDFRQSTGKSPAYVVGSPGGE